MRRRATTTSSPDRLENDSQQSNGNIASSSGTALGGRIFALDSTVTWQRCTVTINQANGTMLGEGGGIYSYGSVLTLVASTVKGNKATTGFADIFVGP